MASHSSEQGNFSGVMASLGVVTFWSSFWLTLNQSCNWATRQGQRVCHPGSPALRGYHAKSWSHRREKPSRGDVSVCHRIGGESLAEKTGIQSYYTTNALLIELNLEFVILLLHLSNETAVRKAPLTRVTTVVMHLPHAKLYYKKRRLLPMPFTWHWSY